MADETIDQERNGRWKDLVKHCIGLYEDIKKSEYRIKKLAEIERSRNTYEQIPTPIEEGNPSNMQYKPPWDGASNIVLPLTTISVDNLEPRLVAGLVGQEPYVEFSEESEEDQSDDTKTLQAWYNAELKNNVKIVKETGTIVHILELEGTVFPMVEYDIDEQTTTDFKFYTQEEAIQLADEWAAAGLQAQNGMLINSDGSPVLEEKPEVLYEGGKITLIPFSDVFIPDDATDWEKTPVIRKVRPTYGELMRDKDKPGYMNIDAWVLKETADKITEDAQTPAQKTEGVEVTGLETIECIECILAYTYKDDEQDDEDVTDWTEEKYIVQIAIEREVIVRLRKLRDLNWRNQHYIKRIRMYPEEGKAYGTSIYGKMRSIQDGASKTFNHCINIAEVVLMPWFFFGQGSGVKGDITIFPGQGVEVDDIKQILFPNFNINPSQYIDFLYLWTSFWEKLISIGDLQIGRPAEERGKKTTATEVMAVLQEGNVKHNYQAKTFREEFLGMIRTLYDLYYQNMPLNKTFRRDNEPVQINRQHMKRKFTFTLTGSTEHSNKLIERKEAEDLMQISAADPSQIFSPVPIREDLLRTYGKTDLKKYIDPFMAQLTRAIAENPKLKPIVQNAIQEAMQLAQQLEQAGKEGLE